VLRHGPREHELPLGRYLIGRSESCQLPLDDPLVSRQHVALIVANDSVVLEDLRSRNGVKVNGMRADGNRRLAVGDRLVIGSSELLLAVRRHEAGVVTLVQAPTLRLPAFGLVGALAEKALALGRTEEAEKLIGQQLQQLASEAEDPARKLDIPAVERGAEYALMLASATGSQHWVDVVLRLHSVLGRACSASVVDALYVILRKLKQPNPTELRRYVALLHARSGELGPADRFLLNRLDGLERSLG
jgi:hypothetical protein